MPTGGDPGIQTAGLKLKILKRLDVKRIEAGW